MNDMAELYSCFLSAMPGLAKAVFSQPLDSAEYSKVIIRPVQIKNETLFQAECFKEGKAFHRNLDESAAAAFVRDDLSGIYRQVLITTGSTADQYVLQRSGAYKRSGRSAVPRPSGADGEAAAHNRAKTYILPEGEPVPALVDLGVFTPDYKIVKSKYDKYRQINRFIQIVDDKLSKSGRNRITVLDFGCGKSYLTFILYYYFTVKKGIDAEIIGYDLKADVVENCNRVAEKYGYDKLKFFVADVTKDVLYDRHIDMVVTLHACDIATDYALKYAIDKKADYIFSVPCCQHEVNSSIRRGGELDIFLTHGIVKERMSALLTDSIRAGILEDMGYSVDMLEFVDFEHSPKNIMLRAERNRAPAVKNIPGYSELARKYGFTQRLLTLTAGEDT